MIRLHFVVEGLTEETFVRTLLTPELAQREMFCDAHRVTTGRRGTKLYRGGHVSFQHLRKDLELWMKQDTGLESWFTTMIDLYRLPLDFPGISESHQHADPMRKVEFLEGSLGSSLGHPRFIPYIQLHEFEALVFSDPPSFAFAFPGIVGRLAGLEIIRRQFQTPEHIDEGDDTSPSKRIHGLLPEYVKPVSGPLIAGRIGLPRLRAECPHFDGWLRRLESLGA